MKKRIVIIFLILIGFIFSGNIIAEEFVIDNFWGLIDYDTLTPLNESYNVSIGKNATTTYKLYVNGTCYVVDGVVADTLNTGYGDNELYEMNQNVATYDNVRFLSLYLSQYLYHFGDLDTYIGFTPDRIEIKAGGGTGDINILGDFTVGGDATVGGELFGNTIISNDDLWCEDDIFIVDKLEHVADADTYMDFNINQILFYAGGTKILDVITTLATFGVDLDLDNNKLLNANLTEYTSDDVFIDNDKLMTNATGGGLADWNRSGTTLYPATDGDNITLNNTGEAFASSGNISLKGDYKTIISETNLTVAGVTGTTIGYAGNVLFGDEILRVIYPFVDLMMDIGRSLNRFNELYLGGDVYANDSDVYTSAVYGDGSNLTHLMMYAELTDNTDQTFPLTGNGYVVNFSTTDEIDGISHVAGEHNITIIYDGVYQFIAQPQVHAGAGGAGTFHMWFQKDTGGGYVDIANTNIEMTLASNDEDVGLLCETMRLNSGDRIRIVVSVSDTKIELDAQTPAGEPAIPSIILSVIGNR